MDKNYYTYVLKCADDSLYCGYTDNVEARLATHNAGEGAKYTRGRRPVTLLVALEFPDKETAMKCEWWFKNKVGTRAKKLELVNSQMMRKKFELWQESRKK